MQRLTSAVLFTLILAVTSPSAVRAQSQTSDLSISNPTVTNGSSNQLTPFDLAFFAYRGYLQDKGIPSGQFLVTELEAGNVSVKDIVQAAIKAHQLSEQTLSDTGYLNALESELHEFLED